MNKRSACVAAAALVLSVGGITPALAGGGGGGAPPNAHGLCTAAANGEKNGQPWQNGTPPPWQRLDNSYLDQAAGEGVDNGTATRDDINTDCQNAGVPISGGHNGS